MMSPPPPGVITLCGMHKLTHQAVCPEGCVGLLKASGAHPLHCQVLGSSSACGSVGAHVLMLSNAANHVAHNPKQLMAGNATFLHHRSNTYDDHFVPSFFPFPAPSPLHGNLPMALSALTAQEQVQRRRDYAHSDTLDLSRYRCHGMPHRIHRTYRDDFVAML